MIGAALVVLVIAVPIIAYQRAVILRERHALRRLQVLIAALGMGKHFGDEWAGAEAWADTLIKKIREEQQ